MFKIEKHIPSTKKGFIMDNNQNVSGKTYAQQVISSVIAQKQQISNPTAAAHHEYQELYGEYVEFINEEVVSCYVEKTNIFQRIFGRCSK